MINSLGELTAEFRGAYSNSNPDTLANALERYETETDKMLSGFLSAAGDHNGMFYRWRFRKVLVKG